MAITSRRRALRRCSDVLGSRPRARDLAASGAETALKAASRGVVELFCSPDDRRALQVALTPRGRRELERRRMPSFDWLFTLLNGLEPRATRETQHVLTVIRQRLERYEWEWRVSRASARRSRTL